MKTNIIIELLKNFVSLHPMSTLSDIQKVIQDLKGVRVSLSLIRVVMKREGLTRKQVRFFGHPKDLESKTRSFLSLRNQYLEENREIYSLDEVGFGRNCKPVYGYSKKGTLIRASKRPPRITNTSVIAVASKKSGFVCVQKYTKPIDSITFSIFLLELTSVPNGSVLMMDNVSFHHSKIVKAIADAKQWTLLYTPPYSPWFNPIEGLFSVVKRHFYKSHDIDGAFQAVDADKSTKFFDHSFRENEMHIRV